MSFIIDKGEVGGCKLREFKGFVERVIELSKYIYFIIKVRGLFGFKE